MADRADTDTIQIKVRLKEATRAELETAAKSAGWPLNREIANRLDASLREEAAFGGPATANLLKRLATDIAAIERLSGKLWSDDYATWFAITTILSDAIREYAPLPPNAEAIVPALERKLEARKALLAAAAADGGKMGEELQEALQRMMQADVVEAAAKEQLVAVEAEGTELHRKLTYNRLLAQAMREMVG